MKSTPSAACWIRETRASEEALGTGMTGVTLFPIVIHTLFSSFPSVYTQLWEITVTKMLEPS